ncbi:MAG: hypothetical protein R2697_00965 [Ilumatobacteraceae bacterium]
MGCSTRSPLDRKRLGEIAAEQIGDAEVLPGCGDDAMVVDPELVGGGSEMLRRMSEQSGLELGSGSADGRRHRRGPSSTSAARCLRPGGVALIGIAIRSTRTFSFLGCHQRDTG